jgi:sphingolipid delta-4 desaturase
MPSSEGFLSSSTATVDSTNPLLNAHLRKIPSQPVLVSSIGPFKRKELDFTWSETDEPHATRRKLILAKYPQIQQLFTNEPKTFLVVCFVFCLQLTVASFLKDASWPVLLVVAYVVGGTATHCLSMAGHELSHNLCWKNTTANKLTACFANFTTGIPSAITFQRYHMEHHQFQGVDGWDVDVPSNLEVKIFHNSLLKVLWVIGQPVFYVFRPLICKPKNPTRWEAINWAGQIMFNVAVVYFIGAKAFYYMIIGNVLGTGLHPSAGHFIAEHYEMIKGMETYSYYGPVNYVNFNVGYHNEHHDFPRVPWSKLPLVKKIAPEFYDTLPCYTSYLYVFYRYITDPMCGPFARVKRMLKKDN